MGISSVIKVDILSQKLPNSSGETRDKEFILSGRECNNKK